MSIFHVERNPTQRQLQQFGTIGAGVLFVVAWLQRQSPFAASALCVLGVVALGCTVWGPAILRRPFVWLSAVLYPIGLVVGEVLLMAVYFLVFTPVALFFRLIARDALERALDPTRASYWRESPRPRDAKSYFQQY